MYLASHGARGKCLRLSGQEEANTSKEEPLVDNKELLSAATSSEKAGLNNGFTEGQVYDPLVMAQYDRKYSA